MYHTTSFVHINVLPKNIEGLLPAHLKIYLGILLFCIIMESIRKCHLLHTTKNMEF